MEPKILRTRACDLTLRSSSAHVITYENPLRKFVELRSHSLVIGGLLKRLLGLCLAGLGFKEDFRN